MSASFQLSRIGPIAIAMVLILTACGSGDSTATVRMTGSVFTVFTTDRTCAEYANPDLRPEEISGITLSFADSEGRVLGTTTTGVLVAEDVSTGCRFEAKYEIVLDRADSYQVGFDPPQPRTGGGMYFDGANALVTRTIGYDVLVENDLTWDFEAPPQWVTT